MILVSKERYLYTPTVNEIRVERAFLYTLTKTEAKMSIF